MFKKTLYVTVLTVILANVSMLVINPQSVKADGMIYIRADGSVEGTIYIQTADNVTYFFVADITGTVVVERDNIILDGSGYTLRGGYGYAYGLYLIGRANETVKNLQIETFSNDGIWLGSCSNCTISGCNMTANSDDGIVLDQSSSITISANNITANYDDGIFLFQSSSNIISGNNITANSEDGIFTSASSIIVGNTIAGSTYGLMMPGHCMIYHNSFIGNTYHVAYMVPSPNTWDDGYPSGGNYWSGYGGVDFYSGPYQNETGGDGIGDTPLIPEEGYTDHYPLISPWTPTISLDTSTSNIHVVSNATVLDFKETSGSVKLKLSGEAGTSGYVSIIQPVGLNSSNIKVFMNNTKLAFPSTDPPRSISPNGTHYFIYFAFTFDSSCEVVVAFSIQGDINYDGKVNILDAIIMANAFLSKPGQPYWNAPADLNDDNVVNILDAIIMANHFLEHYP